MNEKIKQALVKIGTDAPDRRPDEIELDAAARAIGVSRAAVFSWAKHGSIPTSRHLLRVLEKFAFNCDGCAACENGGAVSLQLIRDLVGTHFDVGAE